MNRVPVELSADEISTSTNIFNADEINEDNIIYDFVNTIFCGRTSTGGILNDANIKSFFLPDQWQYQSEVCTALEAGMCRRRLAVTSLGYLTATPAETKTDGLICVLVGCNVPVVLRKVSDSSSLEEYTFIGECYMHGFMHGEAVPLRSKNYAKFVLQ